MALALLPKPYPTLLTPESPHFHAYLTSGDAQNVLSLLELQYCVKFAIINDCLCVEGMTKYNEAVIKTALKNAYKFDNFQRAIELCELTEKSDFQFMFELSPPKAALIELDSMTFQRRAGVLQLKTDRKGRVIIFGTNETSIGDAYDSVISILRQANSDNTASQDIKDGPCSLLMNIPSAVGQYVFITDKRSINTLERTMRCVLEPNLGSIDEMGNIRVDIIAKDLASTLAAKSALIELIEEYVGKIHNWPTPVVISCGPYKARPIPEVLSRNLEDCEDALFGAMDKSLTFSAPLWAVSRLIGIRGTMKRRIEDHTKCFLVFHTQAKSNDQFPVEIIGRNPRECDAARHYILKFLKKLPRRYRCVESPKLLALPDVPISVPPEFASDDYKDKPSQKKGTNRSRPKTLRKLPARKIFSDGDI